MWRFLWTGYAGSPVWPQRDRDSAEDRLSKRQQPPIRQSSWRPWSEPTHRTGPPEPPASPLPPSTVGQSLRSESKVILRHGSVYGLATILGQAVSILLLPLYTRYLTPADYGALEILYFISGILSIFIGLGVTEAMSRFYFDREDTAWRNRVVSTTILGMGLVCFACSALLSLLSPFAARLFLDSTRYSIHFTVLFLSMAMQFLTSIIATYLRVRRRSGIFFFFSLTQTVATIGLNILFIVALRWGSLGMLAATFVASGLTGVIATTMVLARTGLAFDTALFRDMAKFGLPLIPSSLGSQVAISSDRYFVKAYVSLADAGLYSLGYKFGAIMHRFLTAPFIQVWIPRRLERYGRGDAEKAFARVFTYFLAFLTFASLAVSLLARDLVRILTTERYWTACRIVPLIALAHIVHVFYYHFTIPITYSKRTKYYAYLNVSIGIANLLLNFLLIPRYGAWGAGAATLVTYLGRSAFVYLLASRLDKVVFEVGNAVWIVGIACCLYFAGALLSQERILLDLLVQCAVVLVYPVLLVLFGVLTTEELSIARKKLGHLLRRNAGRVVQYGV